MAIQFACPACQQPIEVDDEWADQTVSCPYCRRVVRAPAQSTLQLGAVPAASQPVPTTPAPTLGGFEAPPPPPPRSYAAVERTERAVPAPPPPLQASNPIAVWSVIIGVAAWSLMVVGLGMLFPIMRDVMEPITSSRPAREQTSAQERREFNRQVQARFQDMVLNDPAVGKRAAKAMLLLLAAEACGLTGLILALFGATRRNTRKSAAVAGILLSGVFLSGQCGLFTFMLVSNG